MSGITPPTPNSRRRRVDGLLLLDKPSGITSTAALARVKRLFNAEKAGHTGTLDPLASGLLPICLGSATRLSQFLLDADKRYVATVRFGVVTTTQDAEGEVIARKPVGFALEDLAGALRRFTGTMLQTPPAHSALKFEGRPHYEYARQGIDVPRASREVTFHALRLLDWRAPDAVIDVACSKGTYVRALAADLGEALGCGGHLAALRRTVTGGFSIAQSVTLEALDAADPPGRDRLLLPPATLVAHLPRAELDAVRAQAFVHGRPMPMPFDAGSAGPALRAAFEDGVLLGVGELRDGVLCPRRVLGARVAP